MSEGVTIWRCAKCGGGLFPEPLLCPRCHSHQFTTDRVTEGVVEEISVIRHMLGQENWLPRRIASVRTSDGQLMTVGLRDESGPGARIELFQEGEALFGRAKGIQP
jgi:uncharacterized OB-fold protein